MPLRLVTPPVQEPVGVTECLHRLRVEPDAEEELDVAAMIRAARQELDGASGTLGRAILTQTWDWIVDRVPTRSIELPLPPLQSVTSISYRDPVGTTQTLASSAYRIVHGGDWPSRIELDETVGGWPWGGWWSGWNEPGVTIRFVAGWVSPEHVPGPIKQWIMARVAGWYAQREDVVLGVSALPAPNIEHMLAALRVGWLA